MGKLNFLKFEIVLIFFWHLIYGINVNAQERQESGIGVQGISYLSPVKTGKMYYGTYGSVNLRSENNITELKFITGIQFHEKVKIIDLGSTLRIFPAKKLLYIGISPYNVRLLTLKNKEIDEAEQVPVSISKGYGVAHLGLQLRLGKNVNIEGEGNYNYFYSSKVAGYSFSLGFVFYNNDLLKGVSKVLEQLSNK
ncbi:MAG: hypothetical protein RL115_431 [Bacteroidota bacterium]|jgi:hypothetical protein